MFLHSSGARICDRYTWREGDALRSGIDLKPSICIVSHNAYGAISGGDRGCIGGVEWQTSLLARWLAEGGYAVSLVTWNEGEPRDEWFHGVRVVKVCPEKAGLPGLRFLHPKWTSLIKAMRAVNAEVYYHNCGECVTGQIAAWCRRNGRAFVFSAASDADCDPHLPELRTVRERVLYRYGLRQAHRRVVQTLTQQQKMREWFGLNSDVIPMPCPGPQNGDFRAPTLSTGRVLWIGRVAPVKRPDRLLDLAAACPNLPFDLVGPVSSTDYSQSIETRARSMANVTLHGAVSRERVPQFYQQAALMCCTSEYEGFPNTFLEAWSHGLPIVSTFDPDGLIARRRLGVVVKQVSEMPGAIDALLRSSERYREASENARRYYLENHTLDAVMPRFERVFLDAIAQVKRRNNEA